MRPLLLSMVFFPWAACAPTVAMAPASDLDATRERVEAPAAPPQADQVRPVAPPGKGLRTGTIPRARLIAVLDAGPGMFLRQIEVAPKKTGDRFVGWELVQLLDRMGPLFDLDLVPGDVLLAINGKPISRPDQLQSVWDSLRTANEVTAQLWRGNARLTIEFSIEPPL